MPSIDVENPDDLGEMSGANKVFKLATGVEILSMKKRERHEIVAGLIPAAGLTLLAGKPKCGKCVLALQMTVAIITGRRFLGRFPVTPGPVIFWSADDPSVARFSERLASMSDGTNAESLRVMFDRRALAPETIHELERMIRELGAVLLVIDCLQAVRVPRGGSSDFVAKEYDEVRLLNDLAERTGIAVLLLHHAGQGRVGVDPFDSVAGSYGVTAATSSRLLYNHLEHGRPDRVLIADGRDIDPRMLAIYRGSDSRLRFGGEGSVAKHWLRLIRIAVSDDSESFGYKEFAARSAIHDRQARSNIADLRAGGVLEKIDRGQYRVIDRYRAIALEIQAVIKATAISNLAVATAETTGIAPIATTATIATTAIS